LEFLYQSIKMAVNKRFIAGFATGIVLFLFIILFLDLQPGKPAVTITLAIAVWMAAWWIFEAVPLAVTALLPVILFPLFGVMDGKLVSSAYFNDIIFLFMGGFLIALAMQKWLLHKRLALHILLVSGVSPGRLLAGFMIATAFLSMWISNTAAAMMMIPIAISILDQVENNPDKKTSQKLSVGLLLGIAYSASVGGIATLVGTPPNLAFARIYSISFPGAPEVSFGQWMVFAMPLSLFFLLMIWVYLYFLFCRRNKRAEVSNTPVYVKEALNKLGKPGFEEKVVFVVFLLFAVLLVFRKEILLGDFRIPGWSNLFPVPGFINDGTIAMMLGVILFLIPAKQHNDFILDWETAKSLPWRIIILFGGGFALAEGFIVSGLSEWIGLSLEATAGFHPLLIIVCVTGLMIFLTEFTSNTATAQMILPIMAALSVTTKVHPLLFMLPATLAGSMAFMLPVATPPNAIIFATNRIRIPVMAKNGLILNFIGIVIISTAVWIYGRFVFGINMELLPDWVKYQ
jgi:solute carrier family 13 (sodium-dependent dicarboxylate transporter), member 2/3/5